MRLYCDFQLPDITSDKPSELKGKSAHFQREYRVEIEFEGFTLGVQTPELFIIVKLAQ